MRQQFPHGDSALVVPLQFALLCQWSPVLVTGTFIVCSGCRKCTLCKTPRIAGTGGGGGCTGAGGLGACGCLLVHVVLKVCQMRQLTVTAFIANEARKRYQSHGGTPSSFWAMVRKSGCPAGSVMFKESARVMVVAACPRSRIAEGRRRR